MKNLKIHVLLVDDDRYFRLAISSLLSDQAIITEAESETQAIDLIDKNYFDLALIDMEIDEANSGLAILKKAKSRGIHSIMVSSNNEPALIERAYEGNCDHFLAKLHYKKNLQPYITQFIKNYFNSDLDDLFKTTYITQDEGLQKNIRDICKINLAGKTVFITGETGVGKSLIGEAIHKQTHSEKAPFIHINCSEIPENLLESELFGHTKGSFTGANENKVGKLQLADGGTLFLDEIGTMPALMQQKLLKAIEQKTFYPIGATKPTSVEFTLISATCDDLFEKILDGSFRKDLFFRISGVNLDIPPLRQRTGDIKLLIGHFITQSPRRFIIKEDALTKLINHPWQGNIRELKKAIDLLSTVSKGIITASDVRFDLGRKSSSSDDGPWLNPGQMDFITENGLKEFIKKIEQETVKSSLSRHKGKITHAIKELKISTSAFYRIFEKINI